MESHAASLVLERLINLKLEIHGGTVAPDFNSLVAGASRDEVLLYAHIHAGDRARVERVHKILVEGFHVLVVQRADRHLEDLI